MAELYINFLSVCDFRGPSEGLSSRFLLLYSGDGGEVKSAEPHGPESPRSSAQLQSTKHLHPETQSL